VSSRVKNILSAPYRVLVEAVDLGGSDGRVSFQKLVIAAVLAHTFIAPEPMPTVLAIAIIAAAFGRTIFLGLINRASINTHDSRATQLTGNLDNRFTDDER